MITIASASLILCAFQIWVLVSSYLAEFTILVILIILALNFAIFVKAYFSLKADPILYSLYSLTFPLIPLSFIDNLKKHMEDDR